MRKTVARSAPSWLPVSRFMSPYPVAVDPALSLQRLVDDYVHCYRFKSFPVAEAGRLRGCVRLAGMRLDLLPTARSEYGYRFEAI